MQGALDGDAVAQEVMKAEAAVRNVVVSMPIPYTIQCILTRTDSCKFDTKFTVNASWCVVVQVLGTEALLNDPAMYQKVRQASKTTH